VEAPKVEFRAATAPIAKPVAPPAPSGPRDPFAPPIEQLEQAIELAYPVPRPTAPRTSAPRTAAGSGPLEAGPVERPEPEEPLPARPPVPRAPDAARRFRLVVALVLGVGAGFVPAHMYAASAEGSLDEMRDELLHEPPPPTDPAYDLLVERYAATRARMVRTKARIEIATAIIWLVAGAGLSLGALRLMPKASR
jgi:hypothetical protein